MTKPSEEEIRACKELAISRIMKLLPCEKEAILIGVVRALIWVLGEGSKPLEDNNG